MYMTVTMGSMTIGQFYPRQNQEAFGCSCLPRSWSPPR